MQSIEDQSLSFNVRIYFLNWTEHRFLGTFNSLGTSSKCYNFLSEKEFIHTIFSSSGE